jgi:hypothetical protein
MRKVLTFLGASLSLTWIVAAGAQGQTAPDMFKDVDQNHWAYQAVENLRAKNIVVGYPDGYFRGKRTLTRYEFAVAIDRLLKSINVGPGGTGQKGEKGDKGDQGDRGPQGEQGPPGMTPEEVATLRRLTQEFRDELAALGNSVKAINAKLDALARAVEDLRARIDAMPKIYGNAFVGIRADRAHGFYADRDGRELVPGRMPFGGPFGGFGAGNQSLVNSPVVLHEFMLGVRANIPGGATVDAGLVSTNYKSYLNGNLAQDVFAPGFGVNTLNTAPGSDTYIHHLEIDTPFTALGRGSKFTIGRYAEKLGHLTLWKPDIDSYFDNPIEDTGDYYVDGARLRTNFGSVAFEAFGGKFSSVTGTVAGPWNSPLAGAATPTIFAAAPGSLTIKPMAQPYQGQMTVDNAFGISGGFGFNLLDHAGHLRLTALGLTSDMPVGGLVPPPGFGTTAGTNFTNTLVLGADADLHVSDRLGITLDWAKSITGVGRFRTVNSGQDNAFNATVGYGSGGLNVSAGYRYIDPLFYSPGYWGRIGNWYNPTNIQGPTFRAAYDFSPSFGINLGGDFFTPARNRGPAGLGPNEEIDRALLGIRWGLSKGFNITADYEGVFWALQNARGGGGAGEFHPTEQYITFGTGYNLTSSTMLKLSYQIGDFNGHGGLAAGTLNGGSTRYNFNTFTGQVAVKF